jgi:Spy/CpxP family protein refolding chaperone
MVLRCCASNDRSRGRRCEAADRGRPDGHGGRRGGGTGVGSRTHRGPAAAPAGGDKRSSDQLRKEVLERMRALRAWRIVEELKLDETASARLFPILAKYDEQELALAAERRDIAQELRGLLAAPRPDDAKLTAAIERMLANRVKRHALKDERIKELRKVLTPVQQAKLVLLLPRLEREFAQFIREVAGQRDDGQ